VSDDLVLDKRLKDFVERGQRAQAAAAQIAYHGPGLTFGELAIGELFEWPPPLPQGCEPIVKTADDRYEWSRGYGTAEPFYRVERVTGKAKKP
jgi:hypothetical protein